ncbi:MAG TPA: DNA polymerase/3'-5' exonuclease PolX [Patescibacteria group bacterium]|nr:DNA polymerase/3'-5' exonuclease PolX [Patescibacteria group bacterium]
MTNKEIGKILFQIAKILELGDERDRFRIIAYERASETIENYADEMIDVYKKGGLKALNDIPGVGESIAEKIEELLKTGKLQYFDEIKKDVPVSEVEFLQIPGIGPKTAQIIAHELKARDIEDLAQKIKKGKAKKIFKEKTAANILRGIEILKRMTGRMLLTEALPIAEEIVSELKKIPEVGKVDFVGSLRRMRETVGDVDIVATSPTSEKVIDHFTKLTAVKEVLAKGSAKSTIIHSRGAQIDLEIVPEEEYGSLLQHFTGSKEHNVALRTYAQSINKSLSEHGANVGKKKYKFSLEKDFYGFLKMAWIPPELRENQGEIEAALKNNLPTLIMLEDIKGDLHVHSNWSDGYLTISEIARIAEKLEYQYICISDHTVGLGVAHGLDERALEKRQKEIETVQKAHPKLKILSSVEVNIKANGDLDIKDWMLEKLDIVTASVHTSFYQNREIMTKRLLKAVAHPHVDIIGHPSGRIIGQREPYEVDWQKVFKAAAKHQTALEISAFPNRLDLKDTLCKEAKTFGVKFAVNTDSHQAHHFDLMRFGVAVARRGWLGKEDIINTLNANSLLKWSQRS